MNSPYRQSLNCLKWDVILLSWLAIPASAKALRSIQINDLPEWTARRVLGVIRPTVECIGSITQSRHVGVLATAGTIKSESYPLEIHKLFPDIQ